MYSGPLLEREGGFLNKTNNVGVHPLKGFSSNIPSRRKDNEINRCCRGARHRPPLASVPSRHKQLSKVFR